MELDVHLDSADMSPDGGDPVGTLTRGRTRALTFVYHPDHVGRPGARPISLSLPVRAEPYDDRHCRPYFENLLPEGGRRMELLDRHRLAVDDVGGLLAMIGRDCPGAVSVVPKGDLPTKVPGDVFADYRPLPPGQIADDVEALMRQRVPRRPVRFSLAGVQSKLAVTVDPGDPDRFLEPSDERHVPSTHILKIASREYPGLVENEHLCMRTAAGLGFDVAETRMLRVDGRATLLVRRFDRQVADGRLVHRLHQEDGCQALGLLSADKYQTALPDAGAGETTDAAEAPDGPSWRAFGDIAWETEVPAQTRGFLVRTAALNFLLGNDDGHAKNLSFLLDRSRPRPAPLYDLVCTARYPELADSELSLWIGRARRPGDVTARAFREMLQDLQLPGSTAARWTEVELKSLAENVMGAFDDALRDSGILGVVALPIRDAIAARVAHLADVFGWTIPVTVGPLGLPR